MINRLLLFFFTFIFINSQGLRIGGFTNLSNLKDQGLIAVSDYIKSKHKELINATITKA